MEKTKVFILVDVKKELPDFKLRYYMGIDCNERFCHFSFIEDLEDNGIDFWLNGQEGYFFTPFDLINFLKYKIMDAVDGAAIYTAKSRSAQLEEVNRFVESLNI